MECALRVVESGYEIIEAKGQPLGTTVTAPKLVACRFLVPRVRGSPTHSYKPFSPDYGGLPFNFAELRTEEDLVEFANRYGMLGPCHTHWVDWPGFERSSGYGEPLRAWTDEILAMDCAVQLWKAARNNDLDSVLAFAFASLKHRVSERLVYPERPIEIARRSLSFHDGYPSELLQSLQGVEGYDEPSVQEGGPSLEYRQFQESVRCLNLSPAFVQGMSTLRKLVNHKLESGLQRRLYWAPNGKGLELHDSPLGLLGAMWTLLAHAIVNNRSHARCLDCGSWLEVSKFHRQGLYYCNSACKMKAYRRRKKGIK
jgi:hypothetical protein